MKLEYYGHSCFRLTFPSGTRIVTDPYGQIGYSLPPIGAEVVTVSHGHYDHCNVGAVSGSPAVLSAPVSREIGGVRISAVSSFHDEVGGAKRGKNLIFRFQADGLEVCHLGDLGEPIDARLTEALRSADVLLIPVGGHYTIDGAEAGRYVESLAPKIAVPMHYYTPGLQVDIKGVERFLSRFGAEQVTKCKGTLELDSDSIKNYHQKIIVMERI